MARRTGAITGTVRVLAPLPTTVTESTPATGASCREMPSASEMRSPAP
jgi:hypothetical protein